MRIRAGNQLSGDARTLGFPSGWALAENDGDVEVSGADADLVAAACGFVSWTFDPVNNNTNTTVPTQTIAGTMLGLSAGATVTNIVMETETAAAGTAPALIRLALLDKTLKVLAVTADVHATAFTAVGYNAIPLQTPYQVLSSDGYYAAVVINGTWVTTQPQFLIGNTPGNNVTPFGTRPRRAFKQAGQTDFPAVGASVTPATATQQYWFGVS